MSFLLMRADKRLIFSPKLRFVSDKNDPTLVSLPKNNLKDEEYEPESVDFAKIDPAKDIEVKYVLRHKYVAVNKDNSHFDVNPGAYRRTATALVRYDGAGVKNLMMRSKQFNGIEISLMMR